MTQRPLLQTSATDLFRYFSSVSRYPPRPSLQLNSANMFPQRVAFQIINCRLCRVALAPARKPRCSLPGSDWALKVNAYYAFSLSCFDIEFPFKKTVTRYFSDYTYTHCQSELVILGNCWNAGFCQWDYLLWSNSVAARNPLP